MSVPIPSLKQLVDQQFAQRPTLRQVLAQEMLKILVKHYPLISGAYPDLDSTEPFHLMDPPDSTGFVRVRRLSDRLLRAFLSGQSLGLTGDHHLSLHPPARFRAVEVLPEQFLLSQVNLALDTLNGDIENLLRTLPETFARAQVAYWHGAGRAGLTRDRWLRHVLRMALATHLDDLGLDGQEVACLQGLLSGGQSRPTVHGVQVELGGGEHVTRYLLPDLLVSAELDERQVLLWCPPAGLVRSFTTQAAFVQALGELLAQNHVFDSLSCSLHEVEGDAFSQQVAMMLDAMLADLAAVRFDRIESVAALEATFAELSAPGAWFTQRGEPGAWPTLQLPGWLDTASDDQRFAYQSALLDLVLAEGRSEAGPTPAPILDLHSYASQQLRAQLLADHPVEANYYPDDLLLTLVQAQGVPGGAGVSAGGGEPLVAAGTQTLTAFAIGNLSALGGASIHAIQHRDGQLIMGWLTADYLKHLVERVDIGGRYPAYVKQQLDDPRWRSLRVERFARQWRCRLLLDALRSRVEGHISAAAWQVLADLCDSDASYPPLGAAISQLALRRRPGDSEVDVVHGMFIIRPRDKALPGVLYRPLYRDRPLHEIDSLSELLGLLQAPGALQRSVLDWLSADARRVYDHGGFLEPHLQTVIFDTSILPAVPKPPEIAVQGLSSQLDEQMYRINGECLVELADRQSVSTAESRWALLVQGAWLLFDVASLLLPGPVGLLAWVVQGVSALLSDLEALSDGDGAERSAAVMDLLLNVGLLLLHARAPAGAPSDAVAERLPGQVAGLEPRRQGQSFQRPSVSPLPKRESALQAIEGRHLDFSWTGVNGLNALAAPLRARLRALRSRVSLHQVSAEQAGAAQGLYRVGEAHYVQLVGDTYRTEVRGGQWRVVGPAGEPGPYLVRVNGVWRVDAGIRARGGAWDMSEPTKQKLLEVLGRFGEWRAKQKPLDESFAQQSAALKRLVAQLEALKQQRADAQGALANALDAQLASTGEAVRDARLGAVRASETLHAATEHLDRLLGHTPMVRYAGEDAQGFNELFSASRGELRKAWLGHFDFCINHLWRSIRQEKLTALAGRIAHKPLREVMADYLEYRATLEETIQLQSRMIESSEALDRLIPQTVGDPSIVFEDKPQQMARFKKNRILSTVTLRFRQAINYGVLALRLDKAANALQVALATSLLDSRSLRSAAYSHGEIGFHAMGTASRIEVLETAQQAYSLAITHVQLLLQTGGELIDSAMLERCQAQLVWLRNEAMRALDAAIIEQELNRPVASAPAYDVVPDPASVVQTTSGQTVIGYPGMEGDDVVVRQVDRDGQVQGTLRQQGELWVEDSAPPMPPVLPSAGLRQAQAKAESLLGQQAWVVGEAAREAAAFVPEGVSGTLDGYVGQLKSVGQLLARLGDAQGAGERIEEALKQLEQTRDRLLQQVHVQTPWPTAQSLRYLHDKGLLQVTYQGKRQVLADGSALDKYQIRLLKNPSGGQGRGLWEAHLHYARQDDPAMAFSKAHLKTWAQRNLAYREQLQSLEQGVRLKVYRGNLTLRDMQGIIPLN